ncbi:family 43 glycoside hydrolase [Xylaria telfairii]|nr:family 43 glycoside hydrolase [Xylaria telfairii]
MFKIRLASLLSCLFLIATAQATYIVPGARWRDTEGNIINAYAGNVVFDQGAFWLFGEYKTEGQGEGGGVAVYSSKDLSTWQSHGLALKPIESHPYISPSMIIQRPKVMWWHADNSSYGLLLQGFASSDKIEGPYDFINATSPLGNWSQDFGLFTDWRDGRSYALYSNGDSKEGRDVYLTSYNKEVSALDKVVHRFEKYDLEAPTIIQTDKSYYALMSHKTGYRPNNVVAFRADKLSGPWSQPFIVFPLNTRAFNSQSGFTLRIQGSKKTTYLYLGDRWDANSIWESRHIWLPIDANDERKTLEVKWYDVYDLDVQTGEWLGVKGQTYGQKHATPNGGAFKQEANFANDGTIITGIYGNDSTVTFHGIEGTGKPQWVSFYYQNTDDMGYGDQPGGSPDRIGGAWQLRRISSVIVNGDTENVETLYQVDTHKGIILSTPLQLTLTKGRQNTITVGGLFNGFDYKGADLEKIVVYPPEE